jgi:hypothetical protein
MARSKKRIEELLNRLKNGTDVAVRDLKGALTTIEYENYKSDIENANFINGNSFVQIFYEYEELIAKADFTYSKAEGTRVSKSASKKLHDLAQVQYEHALELFRSELSVNPSIIQSYDRNPDGNGADVSLSPAGVPRAINSKSVHKISNKTRISKRELKIRVLEDSLNNFENSGNIQKTREINLNSDVQELTLRPKIAESQGEKLKRLRLKLK